MASKLKWFICTSGARDSTKSHNISTELPGPEATGTSKQSRARFLMPLRGGSGFPAAARKKRKTKGRGGPLRVALRHSHARNTAPYHPQPTGGLCQGPCGSGGHCRGRGLPQGHHNGPEEATAGPRHTSSALPRPRPVGHQSAPWPHQTPTKHPRGPAHHPARLWWPLAASGVAKRVKTGPWPLPCPGWVCPGSFQPSGGRGARRSALRTECCPAARWQQEEQNHRDDDY